MSKGKRFSNLSVDEQHQLVRKVRWFFVFGSAITLGMTFLFGLWGLAACGIAIYLLWRRSNSYYRRDND